MKKLDIGSLVKISFLDHCQTSGLSEPITCHAFGIIVHTDKNAVYVCSWISDAGLDHNADCYAIVRSCIVEIDVFKKKAFLVSS